jgi:plastocyanin
MQRFIVAAVLALGCVTLPRVQAAESGTIVGRVTLKRRIGGAALPSTAYPTRAVGPRATHPIPEIRNVVVYLKDPAYRGALPPRRVDMQQEHETFVPHVVAVTRGSVVDFPNDDPIYHNVFSLSSTATFDLGRYPTGQSRRQTLTRAGIVKVYCQIHSHMNATILVFDHPYFTTPALDGSYELIGLPAGVFTLVGWHERVGERTTEVRVDPGRITTVDLSLPVDTES